MGYSL
jgi:hypothetical protein